MLMAGKTKNITSHLNRAKANEFGDKKNRPVL